MFRPRPSTLDSSRRLSMCTWHLTHEPYNALLATWYDRQSTVLQPKEEKPGLIRRQTSSFHQLQLLHRARKAATSTSKAEPRSIALSFVAPGSKSHNSNIYFIIYLRRGIHKNSEAMRLTDLDMFAFKIASVCHMCKKPFKDDNLKVWDFCHLTRR